MSEFNFNFKEGDKVYYPMATNEILSVDSDLYVSYLDSKGFTTSADLCHDGKWANFHHNPTFFPATQEWYDKLVHVYPNLEKPPKRKEPKDIIQAMLDSGYNEVLAYVSDEPIEQILQKHKIALIYYIDSDGRFVASGDFEYDYAVPYCHKAGKKIIDFVDGKCVL